MHLDHISNEFDGQGHRSKFKVSRLKNVIFGQFYCLFLLCVTWYITMALSMVSWRHVTSRYDVMMACNVMWRHSMTSWWHVTSRDVTVPLQILAHGVTKYPGLWCDVMTSCDVTEWCHDASWRHRMTSWRQITSVWQKRLWHIRGRCINAGAFSFKLNF